MVIEIFYDTLIRSLDETPKIMEKFFKMLKIGYGEDFKMSGRIYTPVSIIMQRSKYSCNAEGITFESCLRDSLNSSIVIIIVSEFFNK